MADDAIANPPYGLRPDCGVSQRHDQSQSEAEACRRRFELQSPGQPWRAKLPCGPPLMVR